MDRIEMLYREIIGTEVISDDVFQDRFQLPPGEIEEISRQDLGELWSANPDIYRILREAEDLESAREALYYYLDKQERKVFNLDNDLHPLEKANIRECIRTFRSIIGPINEKRTGESSLKYLFKLARSASQNGTPQPINDDYQENHTKEVSRGFILEFIHLFRGVVGLSGIYSETGICKKEVPLFIKESGRKAAEIRSQMLDRVAAEVQEYIKRYPSGLDQEVIEKRKQNKARILQFFNAKEKDWKNYRWHLKHVIRDPKVLSQLVNLTEEEKRSIQAARNLRIPFGITPYYVSLMDYEPHRKYDHQIRAQVIPPMHYVQTMHEHRDDRHESLDFMGEHDTSPAELITRRYPMISIIKPYNSCAQICVYCQRNWEIEDVMFPGAHVKKSELKRALLWLKEHSGIEDVLITGGDPLILSDSRLNEILQELSQIKHVRRIRIGTRIPVVLPFRITEKLINLIAQYYQPGVREIAFVTHFEHVYEITPEALECINRIRRQGISVYNQSVFTFENSRRFELVALRRLLKLIGVDPYYNFNAKGKEETRDYRVPIARILQERKEEARLLPGLDRTDESVFNVPRLGKNHLRSWQDHRVIMILPDGRRVYEFHPWEKNIFPIPPYNHTDVAIWDYLKMLQKRGENIQEYRTIWYYY